MRLRSRGLDQDQNSIEKKDFGDDMGVQEKSDVKKSMISIMMPSFIAFAADAGIIIMSSGLMILGNLCFIIPKEAAILYGGRINIHVIVFFFSIRK